MATPRISRYKRAKPKKTWQEKLADDKELPKIIKIPTRMQKTSGKGTLVIPAPREVDAVMAKVKKGKLISINAIRVALAKQYQTTTACPICTGIFAWIAANAAQEKSEAGAKRVTPYWRTLKGDNEVNPKYPGGLEVQKALLKAEGHQIIMKGKRMLVVDAQNKMASR